MRCLYISVLCLLCHLQLFAQVTSSQADSSQPATGCCGLSASKSSPDITETGIREKIVYLSSNRNKGRYPGTTESKRVVRYIARDFKRYGVEPINHDYYQYVTTRLRIRERCDGYTPGEDL